MNRRVIPVLAATALLSLVVAACGGGSGSSAAPSAAAPSAGAAGGVCSETKDAGAVAVSIKDFAFNPADITAKVGDIIAFSNGDSTGHTATLVDGACTTTVIDGGAEDGLVFTQAGTYPFRCDIHKQMTGTITIG